MESGGSITAGVAGDGSAPVPGDLRAQSSAIPIRALPAEALLRARKTGAHPVGLNFDPVANVSGACEYSAVCMSDLDGDGYVDVFDLLLMFEAYGYDCE